MDSNLATALALGAFFVCAVLYALYSVKTGRGDVTPRTAQPAETVVPSSIEASESADVRRVASEP